MVVKILLCLFLSFNLLIPKKLLFTINAADSYSSTTNTQVSMYTYNDGVYNLDRTNYTMVLNEWHNTKSSLLFNTICFELTPYNFISGQYIQIDFQLTLGCLDSSEFKVKSASFYIYNTDDKTSSKEYELKIEESAKTEYRYTYNGKIDGLERSGNCIRIMIDTQDTYELGKCQAMFHTFNVHFDEQGKTNGLLSAMIGSLTSLPTMIANALSSLFDGVSNAVSSIGSAITTALTTVKNAVTSIGTAITSALTTVKNAITSALETLGETILNGIKELFLPSDDFIENWFSNINKDFSLQFGFLYYPIEFIAEFFTAFQGVLDDDKAVLSWDNLKFKLPLSSSGNEWNDSVTQYKSATIIEPGSIDLVERRKALFRNITVPGTTLSMNAIFYYFTDSIIYFALVNLAYRKIRGLIK